MRKFILTMLGILGVLAFALYAVIGETGPIGWINAAQARSDGTYSRAISAFVLVIAACLVVLGGAPGRGPGREAAGVDEAPARGARGGQGDLRRRSGRGATHARQGSRPQRRSPPIVSPVEQ